MKTKSKLETHSLSTLAERFKGLVSRGTITAYLGNGKLKPEMTSRLANRETFLFDSLHLDQVLSLLEESHEAKVRRQTASEAEFKEVRERSKREALAILRFNDAPRTLNRVRSEKKERDPALCDDDAIGVTRLRRNNDFQRIQSAQGNI
jgi:hypothetical protein